MHFDKVINYFLPAHMRHNKAHPRYHEFRTVVSSMVVGVPLVLLFPFLVLFLQKSVAGYYMNAGLLIITLLSVKFFGHYRIPMSITALVTYFIVYDWIKDSGLIFSPNISVLHIYLLGAIWADKKYGWWAIFSNLLLFGFIYYQTLHTGLAPAMQATLGGPLYPFGMHCLITIFFGGFLAYQQLDQERDRAKVRALQDQKIHVLDEAVKKRTEQLNSMRENIATDFHDETGNILAAITRQAILLKSKLKENDEAKPVVDSIIKNSNSLYAASKDFLWNLNHNSDDPQELFHYLTGYGQVYYNQFDMAFSAQANTCGQQQLDPLAALNIIYIFKEAMTNVIKHAGAKEVLLQMSCHPNKITYALQDDGHWKPADTGQPHYGLTNMERRCQKNQFVFSLSKQATGTRIAVTVPVNTFV